MNKPVASAAAVRRQAPHCRVEGARCQPRNRNLPQHDAPPAGVQPQPYALKPGVENVALIVHVLKIVHAIVGNGSGCRAGRDFIIAMLG
jgi:hypothetical protein